MGLLSRKTTRKGTLAIAKVQIMYSVASAMNILWYGSRDMESKELKMEKNLHYYRTEDF